LNFDIEQKANPSVKVHHNPGGDSNLILGGDNPTGKLYFKHFFTLFLKWTKNQHITVA